MHALSVAKLSHKKKVQNEAGEIPDDLIANLSQSFERMPWNMGGLLDTPTSSMDYWHNGGQRYLVAPDLFQCIGWPADKNNHRVSRACYHWRQDHQPSP